DRTNKQNNTETRNITVDTTLPSVSSLTEYPADPATYSSSQIYEFNATVTDTSLAIVRLQFNNVNYTATNLYGSVYNVTLTSLPAGVHSYRWIANDSINNINATEIGTYTVNNATGNVELALNGSYANQTDVFGVQTNATANTSYGTIVLYRSEEVFTSNNGLLVTLGAGDYNYTAVSLGDQNHSSTAITRWVHITQISSAVNLTLNGTDGNFTVEQGKVVLLNGTRITGENGGILRLYSNGTLINSKSAIEVSNQTSYIIAGERNITAVYQSSQNYTESSETWYLTVQQDTIAPLVTINVPQNVSYASASISFNVSLNENGSSVKYNLNNGANNVTMTTTDGINYNYTNSSMVSGSYVFKVYANDSFGNRNDTENVTFYFENSLISVCTDLKSPNSEYNLTQNITATGTCIRIQAENVTLNGAGYTINSSTGSGNAILVDGYRNATIKNITVDRFSTGVGVNLTNAYGAKVVSNIIKRNLHGVYILNSNNTNVSLSTLDSNTNVGNSAGEGIFANNSYRTIVGASSITNNYIGIYINSGFNSTIHNNTITNSYNYNIYAESSSYNALNGNTVSQAVGGTGLYLSNSIYNTLNSNSFNSHGSAGASLSNSDNNTFINTITNSNNDIGVSLTNSDNNTFIKTTSNSNLQTGLSLSSSYLNYFNDTTLNSNMGSNGASISASANNTFVIVRANGNGGAFSISNSRYINLTDADLTGSEGGGLSLGVNASNNFFFDLNMSLNGQTSSGNGLSITSSHNNTFTYLFLDANGDASGGDAINIQTSGGNTFFNVTVPSSKGRGIYMLNSYLNLFLNSTFKSPTSDAVRIDGASSLNNNLTNVVITGTAGANRDLAFVKPGTNGTNVIDTAINRYNLTGAGGVQINFKDTNEGEIRYLQLVTGYGTNLSAEVKIRDNSAYFNATSSGLNKSANVTLYNIGDRGYVSPGILRDGTACGASCYAYTSLTATDVIFNVTGGGNYSVGEVPDSIVPNVTINFPANTTYGNSAFPLNFNVSLSENGNAMYSLHGGAINVTMFNQTGGVFGREFNRTNASLADGSYTFRVYANDTTGNRNYTESVTFSIDTSVPAVASLTETPTDPATYSSSQIYEFNATVTDTSLAVVRLQFNDVNYTATNIAGNIYNVTLNALPAGAHSYRWIANDTSNNINATETGTYTVSVASSNVNLTLNGTQGNATIAQGTAILLNGTLLSGDAGNTLLLYNNGTLINNRSTEVSNSTTFSVQGLHNITVIYQASQNFSTSSRTYYVNVTGVADSSTPNVTSLTETPTDPATYSSSQIYEFNATVTDTSLAVVRLQFNDVNYTATNIAGNIYNVTLNALPAGAHSYRWIANDTSNNINASETGTYTVNRATSNVSLVLNTTEGNTTITKSGTILLNATVSSGDPVATLRLYNNGTLINTREVEASNNTQLSIAGLYNITAVYAQSQNYSENATTYYVNVLEIADTFAPNVTDLIPVNATNFNTLQIIEIATNTTDNGNATISSVVANITLPNGSVSSVSLGLANGIKYNSSYSIPTFGGRYNISYIAVDQAGNINNTESSWFNVSDASGPGVTISSPTATTYTTSSYDISLTLSEPGYCEYSLDSGATNSTMTASSGNRIFSASKSGVANGNYVLRAYCNDTSGFANNTESVSFSVSVSSGGTGGGGGGGSSSGRRSVVSAKEIEIDKSFFDIRLKSGEVADDALVITNTKSEEVTIRISHNLPGLLFSASEEEFKLGPGESKSVALVFAAREGFDAGIYVGKLTVKEGSYSKDIPVSFIIDLKKALFDVKATIPDDYKIVETGKDLFFEVTLFNLGDLKRIDAILTYQILDLNNNAVLTEKETIAVETKASFSQTISIPWYVRTGNYVLAVQVEHQGQEGPAISTAHFRINNTGFPAWAWVVAIAGLLVGGLVIGIVAFRKRRDIRVVVNRIAGLPPPPQETSRENNYS
ncbi:MAG: right-handed parallel beta-helix repeat-containing protein, partial [Nanoarchaeota archaeon]